MAWPRERLDFVSMFRPRHLPPPPVRSNILASYGPERSAGWRGGAISSPQSRYPEARLRRVHKTERKRVHHELRPATRRCAAFGNTRFINNRPNSHHGTRTCNNSPMIKAELLQEFRKLAAEAADLRRFL